MKKNTGGANFLNQLAEQGDRKVRYRVGKLFLNGVGVARDKTVAMLWIKRSADQGFAEAQCELGKLYLSKIKRSHHKSKYLSQPQRDKDYHDAYHWFELAAKQDHPEAFSGLFELEFEKLITCDEADWETCPYGKNMYEWATKGKNTKNKTALLDLGFCYELGIGITKNTDKAVEWYEKAAETGNKFGAFFLACIYASDESELKDYNKSWQWFQYAKKSGFLADDTLTNSLLLNRLSYFEQKSDPVSFANKVYPIPYHFQDAEKIEKELSVLFAPYKETLYLPPSAKCIYENILSIQETLTKLAQNEQILLHQFYDIKPKDLFPFYKRETGQHIKKEIVQTWFIIKNLFKEGYENISFFDHNAILDYAEDEEKRKEIVFILINIVEINIELEAITNSNIDLYNDLIHLQQNPNDTQVIKKIAGLFMTGSSTIPRSYSIAREWYSKIPDDPEAKANLAKIEEILNN